MWYRFKEDDPIGIYRVKHYQVAFYDMEHGGDCFDECFYSPNEVESAMSFTETEEDKGHNDRTRVFVHFDDGDVYEIKLVKLSDEQINERRCSNFYG